MEKMNFNKRAVALQAVCLSVSGRQPLIHCHRYRQTALRPCSLAYASLIMQIGSVRQTIAAAVSQSASQRCMMLCAFVSVSLTTLK